MHRAFMPSKQDLIALVDIAESVIEAVYINEPRAVGLQKRIPKKAASTKRRQQQQPNAIQ